MTIAQARALVGNQIGLPESFDGSIAAYGALSPANQVNLTKALINFIRNNPADFSPAQVASANAQAGQAQSLTLDDPSFDFGLFMNELENNAIKTVGLPLAAVGDGLATAVKLVGTLLPVLALIGVAIFVFPHLKKSQIIK